MWRGSLPRTRFLGSESGKPGRRGNVVKRFVAAFLLALMIVPVIESTAFASGAKERVACLFYQTFAERDLQDCFN